jgi:Protein of unknown function (DUF664).
MRLDIQKATEVLERTPKALGAMLDGVSDEWTTGGNKSNWAPFDIIGHLIHGEETDWIPRAEIILQQGNDRTFVPFDRVAQFQLSKGKSLRDLLKKFEAKRRESLDTLMSWNLSDEQLKLKGIHPEFGDVSLSELIAAWVTHDLSHISQIAVFMARKYTEAVGPWKEYMSILR